MRERWLDVGLLLLVAAMAWGARAPFLDAVPYGDENLHYITARNFSAAEPRMTDVWGNGQSGSPDLDWQRPVYYVGMHFPATMGFDVFRLVHVALAALLAPAAYLLVLSGTGSRIASAAAGAVVAFAPPLAGWGGIAFADSAMTLLLAVAWLSWRAGRVTWAAVIAVLAVWTKETAIVALLGMLAVSVASGRRRGTVRLWPIQLDVATSRLAVATLVAPIPILYALLKGIAPGGTGSGTLATVVDHAGGTLGLLLLAVLAAVPPASRPMALPALGFVGFFVAMVLMGRSVEAWYLVPSVFFVIVAVASLPHGLRKAFGAAPRRAFAWSSGGAAAALGLALMFVVPALSSPLAAPLSGTPSPTLPQSYRDAEARDADLAQAIGAIPMRDHPIVILSPMSLPSPHVLLDDASHIYLDFATARSVLAFGSDMLAFRVESNNTWLLLEGRGLPMQEALVETYADCVVATYGRYTVIHGEPCPGRAALLHASNLSHGAPT